MRLSDTTIGHVAQLVQIAILTGTDVVDNLRIMVLVNEEGMLELDTEYQSMIEGNISKMLEDATNISE